MEVEAESFYGRERRILLTNHSTGELIPKSRADNLKEKREQLRRKLNRIANQLYNLKYDTEYEYQELKELTRKGECLFLQAEVLKQKVRIESYTTNRLTEQCIRLNFEKKTDISDKSTLKSSTIDRLEDGVMEHKQLMVMTERSYRNPEKKSRTPENMVRSVIIQSQLITQKESINQRAKDTRVSTTKTSLFDIFLCLLGVTLVLLLL